MAMRSSFGSLLRRAELYSVGSDGQPIPPMSKGFAGIRPRKTAREPSQFHELEESMHREGRLAALEATLTPEEKQILMMQLHVHMREVKRSIPEADLHASLMGGWQLVKRANGRAHIVKAFPVSATYEDIARHLGISVRQVHRRVVSAHRKLHRVR